MAGLDPAIFTGTTLRWSHQHVRTRRVTLMPRHVVATVDEIAPGTCKIVAVSGREIGVFNVHGAFYALVNRCPHEGAALCMGPILARFTADRPGEYRLTRHGEMLRCPWHGWEFDIKTGQSWCHAESVKARTYPVEVVPGEALAKGPFVAETVPVSIEQQYVVVEV
jgi:3-phenylpropionate/trans-cinnamate dioxygenase ferredoxin subunit